MTNQETANDREAAEQLYGLACQAIEDLYDTATSGELATRTRAERLADAQMLTLQAIYHELRHGHDQTARQTAVLAEHTRALDDHTGAMDQLRGALDEHGVALRGFR